MSSIGRSSIHEREATAERTLPGGESIPISFNMDRIHPAIIILDAAFEVPVIVMKRASKSWLLLRSSDFFSIALINVIGHNQTLECFDNFQPDCLKAARSVLDPNAGQRIIPSSFKFMKWLVEIFSSVRSCILLPEAKSSIAAVRLDNSNKDKFLVPLAS